MFFFQEDLSPLHKSLPIKCGFAGFSWKNNDTPVSNLAESDSTHAFQIDSPGPNCPSHFSPLGEKKKNNANKLYLIDSWDCMKCYQVHKENKNQKKSFISKYQMSTDLPNPINNVDGIIDHVDLRNNIVVAGLNTKINNYVPSCWHLRCYLFIYLFIYGERGFILLMEESFLVEDVGV